MKYVLTAVCVAGCFFVPAVADALVNINTADKAELMTLTGIGEVKAQAIIDYRTTNGAFAAKEDIQNVSGIGTATYSNIKDYITVAASAPVEENNQNTPTDTSSTSTSQQTSTSTVETETPKVVVSSYVPPPMPKVFVEAGSDRTVIVGAHMDYEAVAYNRDQEFIENATYKWNFGDGSTGLGTSVSHHFEYPGRYVVVVSVAHHTESANDSFVVTASPANLAFVAHSDGSVSIENKTGRTLDLSNWIVRAYVRDFMVPEDTVVLAGASLRISPKTLGFFAGHDTVFAYPNGVVYTAPAQAAAASPAAPAVQPVPAASRQSAYVPPAPEADTVVPEEDSSSSGESLVAAAGTVAPKALMSWWWAGAAGFAVVIGVLAVVFRRYSASSWSIIEES